MSLLDSVKKFIPWMRKDDLSSSIEKSFETLNSFKSDIEELNRVISTNTKIYGKELETIFYHNFKSKNVGTGKVPVLKTIVSNYNNITANVKYINDLLDKDSKSDYLKDNINSKDAFVIRAIDHAEFLTDYITRYVNFIAYQQAAILAEKTETDLDYIRPSKATEKFIKDNLISFAQVLSIFVSRPDEFKKDIESIPEFKLNDKSFDVVSGVDGSEKIDPFAKFAPTQFYYSPILYVRMVIAEYQMKRLKMLEEKTAELKARLIHLTLLNENEHSPQLEKQISYISTRVEKLEQEMANLKG